MEAFKAIVIKFNNNFKIKFKKNYNKNKIWNKIFKTLENIFKEKKNIFIKINFILQNNLIYYIDEKNKERFYIPKKIK